MQIFNTLTRKKEEFKPISAGKATLYNCGPTVYDFAHIGNLRAYIFSDTLRRTLQSEGIEVKQVINITDIGHLSSDADAGEDKMLKALKREGRPITLSAMKEVADKYTDAFVEDMKKLNILMPEAMPKASEHIAEDIEIIKILEEKGATYGTSDGIYFDISAFPDYGKLGDIDISTLRSGARVEENPEKRHPADFALWKFASSDGIGFESPWGIGFPGWHIECSAMSRKYLGQPIDIHTGGIDHIGTHHNGEIAQSELAYGKPLANYWMHANHLLLPEGKMAKSGSGFITLKTLSDKGIHPMAFRFWILQSHYQSPVTFSFEAVKAADSALIRLYEKAAELTESDGKLLDEFITPFMASVSDNLNTADAIATLWKLFESQKNDKDILATLLQMDEVLGLGISEFARKIRDNREAPLDAGIAELKQKRDLARTEKNWELSDELRNEIEARGFSVNDTEEGTKIFPRTDLSSL